VDMQAESQWCKGQKLEIKRDQKYNSCIHQLFYRYFWIKKISIKV